MPKVVTSLGSPIYLNSIRDSAEPIEGSQGREGKSVEMSTRGEGFRHFLCRPFGRGAPLWRNRASKQAGIRDTPVKPMQTVSRLPKGFCIPFQRDGLHGKGKKPLVLAADGRDGRISCDPIPRLSRLEFF